ncbi:MAG: IS66 family transposase [Candidatus Pacebacteria bacterium]|nr:IS66 family transposase [Sphaerochaeta sp.]MDD3663464.1 IS66 family transposase [Candidatus Paceibacterota bacterium]
MIEEQQYKNRILALEDELVLAKADAERWKNLYLAANQKRFGRSSETAEQLGQGLFDEAELENTIDAKNNAEGELTAQKVRTYTRVVSRNRTFTLDASTPVVEIRHDGALVPVCGCGSTMHACGEYVMDTLAEIPASRIIIHHIHTQFECPNCLPEPGEAKIVTANDEGTLLGGTICDPTLLATIVTDKMQFGLPLYRQEQKLVAEQRGISRQAMSGWMMLVGRALQPLGRAMERSLLSYPLWNADETGLRVLKVPDEKESDAARNCFMLVRAATDRDGSRGPVLFNFSILRTNETMADFLKDYHHVLQSDGLSGYEHAEKMGNFTHLGCMVHSRRKAADILKTNKKIKLAAELVALYGTFFHHEGELCDAQKGPHPLADDQYLAKRREILTPDLDALKAWLDLHKKTVLKGSKMETAINYPLDRWEKLTRFLDYPYATSSNQLAENSIRPFALDRKNFLFCITPQGAEVSALYFSLVESCKAMGIDPHAYLTYVFANAGTCRTDEDWDTMIPGSADLSVMPAYYATLRSAKPDPNRTEPYILRGKKK